MSLKEKEVKLSKTENTINNFIDYISFRIPPFENFWTLNTVINIQKGGMPIYLTLLMLYF